MVVDCVLLCMGYGCCWFVSVLWFAVGFGLGLPCNCFGRARLFCCCFVVVLRGLRVSGVCEWLVVWVA